MAAADSRLYGHSGVSSEQEMRCQKVYSGLIGPHFRTDFCDDHPSTGVSLYGVFRQLWANYQSEFDHESICSRVLAFHLLMERTHGDAIQGWTSPIEETEEQVMLHPAVIGAIGSVRLCPSKGFCPKQFAAEVRMHAMLH